MRKIISSLLFISQVTSVVYAESFVVEKIIVMGNTRIKDSTVLRDVPVEVGTEFDTDTSSSVIKEMYATGYYRNIILERDENTLIVKIEERPTIGELKVVGVELDEKLEKLFKDNDVANGRVYDPNTIKNLEREITNHFLMQQKFGVKVSTEVKELSRSRVELKFDIFQGNIAKIKRINFVGNKAFSDKELNEKILHKTSSLFSFFTKDDLYSKEKLAAEIEQIKAHYSDNGYINVKVESALVSISPNKTDVHITFIITEGDLFTVKAGSLDGEFVVPRKNIAKIIETKIIPGQPFSRQNLSIAQKLIQDELGSHGYSNAEIPITDKIDEEKKTVQINFYINPHKQVQVRKIIFSGNEVTLDKVLRREVEQYEGAVISTKKIEESKISLMRAGYAKDVNVKINKVEGNPNLVDLIYEVDEMKTTQVSAGISYARSTGLSGNLGADIKNVAGTGTDLNFNLSKSKTNRVAEFTYFDPYFTDSGVGLSTNVYMTKTELSKASDIFEYGKNSYGVNIGTSLRLFKYTNLRLGIGADRSKLSFNRDSAPSEALRFLDDKTGETIFSEYSLSAGISRNTLNRMLFPTKGNSQNLSLKLATPFSDIKLYRVDYNFNHYLPVWGQYTFNTQIEVGYQGLYKGKVFPFYKHYFLGGSESIRGFDEKSLGPKGSTDEPFGGNASVLGRLQIIFPPPLMNNVENLRTALFVEGGQVYDTLYRRNADNMSRNPAGLRYSAGLSLSWHTPLGIPFSVSLARPLNLAKGDKKREFSFTIGTQLL